MSRLPVCGSRARGATAPAESIGVADPRNQLSGGNDSTGACPLRAMDQPRAGAHDASLVRSVGAGSSGASVASVGSLPSRCPTRDLDPAVFGAQHRLEIRQLGLAPIPTWVICRVQGLCWL